MKRKLKTIISLINLKMLLLSGVPSVIIIGLFFVSYQTEISKIKIKEYKHEITVKTELLKNRLSNEEFKRFREYYGLYKVYYIQNGVISLSSIDSDIGMKIALRQITSKDKDGVTKSGVWGNENGLLFYYTTNKNEGVIAVETTIYTAKAGTSNYNGILLKYIGLIILLTAIALFVLIYFKYYRRVKKIDEYLKGFDNVLDLDYYDKKVQVEGKDVLSSLHDSINTFLVKVKTKISLIEEDRRVLKKVFDTMKLKNSQMISLYEFAKTLSFDIEINKIYEKIAEIVFNFMSSNVLVVILQKEDKTLETEICKGIHYYKNAATGTTIEEFVLKQGKTYKIKDTDKDARIDLSQMMLEDRAKLNEVYVVPLKSESKIIGVMIIDMIFDSKLKNTEEVLTLSTIGEIIGRAVDKALKYREMNIGLSITAILYRITSLVEAKRDLYEIFKEIIKSIKKVVDYTSASIYLINEKNELEKNPEYREGEDDELLESVEFKLGTGIKALVAHRRDTVIIDDLSKSAKGLEKIFNEKNERISSFASVPMLIEDKLIGVINLTHKDPNKFRDEDRKILRLFANQAASTIEKVKKDRRIEELLAKLTNETITDELTQLYNRRYMQHRLAEEIERARRENLTLGVLVLDIDFFKKFNDKYGHQVGDAVLSQTAQAVRESIRVVDIPCRFGGEEFLVILPNTSYEGIAITAERIRKAVSQMVVEGVADTKVTISIGAAAFPINGYTSEVLIQKADNALYKSKANGRNRVTIYVD